MRGVPNELSRVLEQSLSRPGGETVRWLVPVTAESVHRMESLCLLADATGYSVDFKVSPGLSERERAFFDDIVRSRATATASRVGRWSSKLREYLGFAGECLKLVEHIGGAVSRRAPVADAPLRTVALVGVYGFEHVGDMGILGGVLLRIHRRFGVEQAHLLSYRPGYTRRLAAGLDTPVALHVHSIGAATAERVVRESDAVIWAGGPLMDLPRILVRNLWMACAVRRRGGPFFLEGIGVGPFRRRLSRWAARRLVGLAQRVSVRTRGASADPVLKGIDVEFGCDPAFDYLATRDGSLTRLDPRRAGSIQALLRGSEDRLRVGLNIRRIRPFYRRQPASASVAMEQRFMDDLVDGLARFARECERPVSYVFFPMNLIQVGESDLAAAFDLSRRLGDRVDLRVWQADPDVDDVIYLMRRLHIAVTMRFHAGIFALSQRLPTIGIDYQGGGKVENLFCDLGRSEDVRRMETMRASWLVNRLEHHRAGTEP